MAPITRICSALSLALLAGSATARQPEQSALLAYVQARNAAAQGESEAAVAAYAAAIRAEPDNVRIASRAFREAVAAGDRALAIEAALQLHRAQDLPADAVLLLIGHYLQLRKPADAAALVAQLERESEFAPFLPFLRGWIGLATQDPLAAEAIKGTDANDLGSSITLEQRGFISLLSGRKIEALSLLRSGGPSNGRSGTTRILAAATLQKLGEMDLAHAMVSGNNPDLLGAQKQLTAKEPLGGAIDTPVKGLAFFYARVASEMARNRVGYFAMTLGRYAGFLDPQSPFIALAEAQGLAAQEQDQDALTSLERVGPQSAYAPVADENRIALLQRLGRVEEAVRLARATAERTADASDFVRLGDALTQMARHEEAASAYDKALNAVHSDRTQDDWGLWLLKGSALEKAGDWPAAEAALRKALALGPDQPAILNLLGYTLLERRQNIPEATALIARAAELKPEDAAIIDSLGWAHYLSGDFDRAVATLENAAIADENEPTIREHLGDAYWRNGQRVAARYAWRAAQLLAEGDAAPRLADKVDIGLTDKNEAR